MLRLPLGSLVLLLALQLGASGAFAADGVIEINQTSALAGGITPGDVPGFPVTISQSGSYRLTGNLTTPGATGAIEIAQNFVTLDLGGFLIGCAGCVTTSCPVFGIGPGIFSVAYLAVVPNGSVAGMNGAGISLGGHSSVVEDVRVLGNGCSGIETANFGRVLRSFAGGNGAHGIVANAGATVEGNEVRSNGGSGILYVGNNFNGSVVANRAYQNTSGGIVVSGPLGSGPLLSRNVAKFNGGSEIIVGTGTSLLDNLCGGAIC